MKLPAGINTYDRPSREFFFIVPVTGAETVFPEDWAGDTWAAGNPAKAWARAAATNTKVSIATLALP
jgi:hypothetical protein